MSTNSPDSNNPYANHGGASGDGGYSGQQPYAGQPGSHGVPPQGQQLPSYGTPYPGGGPQGQGFQPAGGYPANNLGGWALGLGIAGFLLCGFFTGIPAIIVGLKGMRAAREGRANNRGMSLTGLILGIIVVVLSLISIIVLFVLFSNPEFQREFQREMNEASTLQAVLPLMR